jgi:hypothetical protein
MAAGSPSGTLWRINSCTRRKVSGISRDSVNCARHRSGARGLSTSYVERQNLTMRMSMRRFTRLTNAFIKKVENHAAAVCCISCIYNFARVHQTLRVTPAMEAGVANHVESAEEIVGLLN